jgi:hypothetical protein
MTVRYHTRRGHLRPDYVCQREGIERGESFCQTIPGGGVDQEVRALLLQMMTPVALDVALAVQQELQGRLDEADRLRHQQVERARYEADLAQQRYLRVDPNNRLVANALEGDWNDKLRVLTEAQENYERQRQADRVLLDDEGKARVYALITDFPDLWCSPEDAGSRAKADGPSVDRGRDPPQRRWDHDARPLQGRHDTNRCPPHPAVRLGGEADETRSGLDHRLLVGGVYRKPNRGASECVGPDVGNG